MRESQSPLSTRIGPLGVVAVIWVSIAILFPSEGTDSSLNVGAGNAGAATVDATSSSVGNGVAAAPGSGLSPGGTASGGDSATAASSARTAQSGGGGSVSAGGVGASSLPAGTAAGAGAGGALTRGGLPCSEGVRQIPVSTYATSCLPAWSGDNGGATARGVSGTEIIIVERTYPDTANSQAVEAVGQQAGAATEEQAIEVWETFKAYFNEQYELYGRTVTWVQYESQYGNSTDEAQSKGREQACLDADVVANEIGAFGVVGTRGSAVTGPFAECAAERGLMVFNGAAYFPERFYRERHPYVWAVTMECERISYQVAEYIGKRLGTKPAIWSGDALMQTQPRAYATYVPNNDEYQHCVDINAAALERDYGITGRSRYNYTLDVSRFPDEAARGIVQFKADGATTIVLACDPISIIFLTQAAVKQAYFPEWLLIGTALQDTDNLAQLYDQQAVDGHLFGMSQLGPTAKILGANGEAGRLFKLITGKDIYDGTDGGYTGLHIVYNLLQNAGPILTPDAIAAGAMTIPPGGAPDFPYGYWSFEDGPEGTPGAGDHTLVEDSREIYWTSAYISEENGTPGTYVETYNGRRFRNGEWPAEDPPIYVEG